MIQNIIYAVGVADNSEVAMQRCLENLERLIGPGRVHSLTHNLTIAGGRWVASATCLVDEEVA